MQYEKGFSFQVSHFTSCVLSPAIALQSKTVESFSNAIYSEAPASRTQNGNANLRQQSQYHRGDIHLNR